MSLRTRLTPIILLLLVMPGLPVAAQSTLDKIGELRGDAAAQDSSDEIDRLARFRARLRRERDVDGLLATAVDEWRTSRAPAGKARLADFVTGQFVKIDRLAGDVIDRVKRVEQQSRDAEASQRLELEYRLRDYDELLSGLFGVAVANAARAGELELDAGTSLAALDQRLRERAVQQANRLRETLPRIDAVSAQIRKTGDSAKAELDAELIVLEERRRRLKSSLGRTIDLLQARNLDANEYVQLLFQATGVISTDLFDVEILRELVGDWSARAHATIVGEGPSWIFGFIVFVVILVAARFLGKLAAKLVRRALAAAAVPLSALMQEFFVKLTANLVFLFGLLIALAQIGVNLGPVLAGLGIAGFIVGFALQDTLSNFASGMMILLYRPYDVGDVVEAAGVSGKVQKMSLVSTTIVTFDNQQLVVPNNKIWGDVIRNVNAAETRRVDLTFGIGYGDDIAAADALLHEIVDGHELVLSDPEPTIKLHNLGDSSVDFIVRPWVRAADYWTVYWDVTRAVKERFDDAGITIPYPQRDLHVFQQAAE